MKIKLSSISLLLILVSILGGCSMMNQDPVEFPIIDGETVYLSDYEGQIVVLNFWASWCVPCLTEMPLIEEFYQEYHNEGFIVIGINQGETEETIRDFTDEVGVSYPIVMDDNRYISIRYSMVGLPYTIFIDENGEIINRIVGEVYRDQLHEVLDSMMKEGE